MTTHGWKSGKEHRIEIWFVEHNKRYYIISERFKDADWVQNIQHNATVSFTINDKVFKGNARIVDQEKVSKLMNTKYKWSQGLVVELTPINLT